MFCPTERFLDPPLPTQLHAPILLILFLTKKRFPVNYQKGIFIKVLDIFYEQYRRYTSVRREIFYRLSINVKSK